MFRKVLSAICLLVLTMSAQAKDIVVDRPVCAAVGISYRLKVMKVELSKKATIVHLNVLNAKWGWGEWRYANPRLAA